jgi:hypothetical protein
MGAGLGILQRALVVRLGKYLLLFGLDFDAPPPRDQVSLTLALKFATSYV